MVVARDEAIEEARRKSELVAMVSHEVRTPMNGVIGLARLLVDTELDATQRSYAAVILESAEALLRIVDDTLDFSKLDVGKVELERVDFDLARVVASVSDIVAASAQAKGVALVTAIEPSVPARLRGDEGRMRQILFNLVGNAVKFTDAGTVTIRVASSPDAQARGRELVCVEIEDEGIGIEGDVSRLFEPFSQATAATARNYGGTGLGLAICARLAAAMGGVIDATSQPGQGSVFRVEIPFEIGAASEQSARTRARPAQQGGVVLIVDDNEINRLVAAKMVGRLGYACDTANNGVQALEMLGRRGYLAVLMDCFMPELDGFDATVALRAREGDSQHTRVIATTAGALDGDRAHCEEAGMDDYVSKPLSLEQLGAALERAS